MNIIVRPRDECTWDLVSLGEIMLRLDPGEGRIRTARQFAAWAGGGEYNVARGLRRCFDLRTAVVTGLVDNEVGRLIEENILQGGVDTSLVRWFEFDGLGRRLRNGINFTERGFGVRGALGVSDRGHTGAAHLSPDHVDWDDIFGVRGARWFHTGGIFAAVSEAAPELIEAGMRAARANGTIVSFDLNYRPSQWAAFGGKNRAQEVMRRLVPLVDVLVGNEEDFTACLGFSVEGVADRYDQLDPAAYRTMIDQVASAYPNLRIIASTLREVRSATINSWAAVAWCDGEFHESVRRPDLEILDRVGGGDSFMAGLAFGVMERGDMAQAVELGAAHGALAMTTPGDVSMATLAEVERLARGAGARVIR